ncbi:MAG: hypothetical protein WBC30_19270 [Candidatus Sulfotelmatobacter sp.]
MNTPRLPFPIQNDPSPSDQNKPDFRTKIVATRLTPRELAAIEAAAESSSQSLAEWLRETVLRAARQRPADPVELLLAEVWALRYTLLNLFYSRAQAESDGTELLPDSIAKIRDQADTRKLQQARKILEDFLVPKGNERGS